MKRFVVSLLSSILAFTAGLVTASSWDSKSTGTFQPVTVNVSPPCTTSEPPPAPVQSYTVSPAREFEFGQNGLKLVPERVQLKSESRSYDIDVTYPQILATPYVDPTKIQKVNRHLKVSADGLYEWAQDQAAQMSYTQLRSGVRNTVNFTYQIGLATDSFLSVNFIGYSYNGVLQDQHQDSFSVNYDLSTGKQVKLSEIFMPRANYLDAISRYCRNVLSKENTRKVVDPALEPRAENFQNWQVTARGLVFHFYACKVVDCGEGDQTVHVPFNDLKSVLNPKVPHKFNIMYP